MLANIQTMGSVKKNHVYCVKKILLGNNNKMINNVIFSFIYFRRTKESLKYLRLCTDSLGGHMMPQKGQRY